MESWRYIFVKLERRGKTIWFDGFKIIKVLMVHFFKGSLRILNKQSLL